MLSSKQQDIHAAKPGSVAARIQSLNARVTEVQVEAAQAELARSRSPTPAATTAKPFNFPLPAAPALATPVKALLSPPLKIEVPGHWPVDERPHFVRLQSQAQRARSTISTPVPVDLSVSKTPTTTSAPVSPRLTFNTPIPTSKGGIQHRETLRFESPAVPRTDYPYEHHGQRPRYDDMDVTPYDPVVSTETASRELSGDHSTRSEGNTRSLSTSKSHDSLFKRVGKRLSESDAGIPWAKFKRPGKEERRSEAPRSKTTPPSPVLQGTRVAPPTAPANVEPSIAQTSQSGVGNDASPTLAIAASTIPPPTALVAHLPSSVGQIQVTVTFAVSNLSAKVLQESSSMAPGATLAASGSETTSGPLLGHEQAVVATSLPVTVNISAGPEIALNPVITIVTPARAPETVSDGKPAQSAITHQDEGAPTVAQAQAGAPSPAVSQIVPTALTPPLKPQSTGPSQPEQHEEQTQPGSATSAASQVVPTDSSSPIKPATPDNSAKSEVPAAPTLLVPSSTPPANPASPLIPQAALDPRETAAADLDKISQNLNAVVLEHRTALTAIIDKLSLELTRLSTDYDAASLLDHLALQNFPEPHRSIVIDAGPKLYEGADVMMHLLEIVAAAARKWQVDLCVFDGVDAKWLQRNQRVRAEELEAVEVPCPLRWREWRDEGLERVEWVADGSEYAQGVDWLIPVGWVKGVDCYSGRGRLINLGTWNPRCFVFPGLSLNVGMEGEVWDCWDEGGLLDEYLSVVSLPRGE